MKKFLKEFKEFAIRGNMFDMAVGVIIGGAFGSIVSALVTNVLTPAIGMIFGSEVDFSSIKLGAIEIGAFLNAVFSFLMTAFCLFLIVKAVNAARAAKAKEEEAAPAPEPEPSDEAKLLAEIRDLLAKK
ncbi:MAG: large conductance mechanosensitive channel protein MscL [Erysipelotrichaceae bacterium]|nr:large conductance mechanosensitive channel protein MscL [Erysipelotrichaceae bacterium]MBQ4252266.1 large conductance mechanosensitive channel protein MscL [Erysipelotrichaceae bacterium]